MKITRNFSLLIFIFLYQSIFAYPWEIAFRTTDALGNASSATVTVYTFNSSTRNYDVYTGGSTAGQFDLSGYNGYADIGDNNTPGSMFSLAGGNNYYIRIGGKYMILTWGSGSYGDMSFSYQGGTNESLSCGFNTSGYSISGPYTWSDKTITLANDFGSDRSSCYGNIHFNSTTLTNVGYSGITLTREAGTFPHTAAGEDNQQVNNYYRKWRNWSDSYTGISYNLATANNYNLTAIYAKQVNATISLNPTGSTITMNGNTITGSQYMYDDQPSYTFAAANQVSSTWISYVFDHWIYDNTTVTSSTIIINYPTGNHSLAAYFIGTARPDPMNIHFTSTDGQYITIAWTEHPDNGVTQYQVWRSVTGGTTGPIATLNRGTTSFTDYAYVQNANGATKLFYTVKAYYAPSGTWNDPGYILNRGDGGRAAIVNNNSSQLNELGKETPVEYSIGNYPNPFNPTTTIDYQLPENGFVTIKVYDILGKEVATLVNENKSAGYYQINFDASKLTSGVYIYTINVNGFAQSKKMLLMK